MSGIKDLALSTGASAAGAIGNQIGYGLGQITGYNDSIERRQLRQQQKLTDMQYNANYSLMKDSYEEQKQMWDSTNMEAQKQHLINAGMNPALMYAKGGAGGSTGSGGGSVGGGQAANSSQMQGAQTQQVMAGMGLQKMQSEIDLNKSLANKNNAEIPKIGTEKESLEAGITKIEAEIKNIAADTALKGEQIKLNELQQSSTKIANEFNEEQNLQLLRQTFLQIRELTARANVATETQNSLIELAKANVNNVLSNTVLNNSKVSLNAMQKSVMRQHILEIVNTISVSKGKLAVDQGQLQIAINALEQNKELRIRELHSGSILNQIRGVANLMNQTVGYYTDYSKAGTE